MRSKKVFINSSVSLFELFVTTLVNFAIPYLIIHHYGSTTNGLISSITQFLSYITLVESGIGAIGRASFYHPLAQNDTLKISVIFRALESFYRKLAFVFLIYCGVLTYIYPKYISHEFSWFYISSLIVILSINVFIQYYIGITYQTLIHADQKKYIPSIIYSCSLLLSLVISSVLIYLKLSIQCVEIGIILALCIRPISILIYGKRRYHIQNNVKTETNVLANRWDGLAHHIAFFIHKNTDIVLLTMFAGLNEVSIYAVYMLVVSGCSKLVNTFSNNLEPFFGNMLSKSELTVLQKRFNLCVVITNQFAILVFVVAGALLSSFIKVYTYNIKDVDYLRPSFGAIMLAAEAMYCIRLPYQAVAYAAGRFKETRNGAIIEAVLNIFISLLFVSRYGLIGVSFGTFTAMLFRTLQYIYFYHTNIIKSRIGLHIECKRFVIYLFEAIIVFFVLNLLPFDRINGFVSFFFFLLLSLFISSLIFLLFFILFFRREFNDFLTIINDIILSKFGKKLPLLH